METVSLSARISQLRADTERWLSMPSHERGLTGFFGVMARASEQMDEILRQTASLAASAIGEPHAGQAIERIGRGKSVERFTLGENVNLLTTLKNELKRVSPDAHSGSNVDPIFPKELENLLKWITLTRNDFAHGRFRPQPDDIQDAKQSFDPAAKTTEFLTSCIHALNFPVFIRVESLASLMKKPEACR